MKTQIPVQQTSAPPAVPPKQVAQAAQAAEVAANTAHPTSTSGGSSQSSPVRAKRFPLHWPLRAGHRTHGVVAGRTTDVSASGLQFQTSAEYAIGELIEMEVALDFKYQARVLVQITRFGGSQGGLNTYGVRFTGGECPGLELIRDKLLALHRGAASPGPALTVAPDAATAFQHPAVRIVEPIPRESRLARLFNEV